MFIDTHAHIYDEAFDADRDAAIRRAWEAGIIYTVLPDIDHKTRDALFALVEQYPDHMLPLLGVHPTSVDGTFKEELRLLEKRIGQQPIYGIGECGIDLYWDKTYYKEQVNVFEWQLHIAHEMNLPVVVHARKSLAEIFAVVQRQHYNIKGILHCFPGNEEEAHRAIDLGFLLGIGGVVTFKNSTMAKVVQCMGSEHLVLETDAPYLTPVPHRGKRNESSYITHIATKVAEILGVEVKKIAEITTKNAMNLFHLQIQNASLKE